MRKTVCTTAILLLLGADLAYAQNAVIDQLNRFADTGPRRENARAIGILCPAGNRLSARLQSDCNTLVGAAFANNSSVRQALSSITADNVTIPIDRSGLGKLNVLTPPSGQSGPGWAALLQPEDGLATLNLSGDEAGSLWSGYVQARFDNDERDASNNEDGFDRNGHALTLGVDRRLGSNGHLGAALTWGRSSLDYTGSSGSLDTDELGFNLYAGWQSASGFYLDTLLGLSNRDMEQVRRISYGLTPTAVDQRFDSDFSSSERLLALTAGFQVDRGALNLNPYARLEWVDASSDGYTERSRAPDSNGAGWAVQVGDLDENFTRFALGLRAAYAISGSNGVYLPYADLSWIKISGLDAQAARLRYAGDLSANVNQSPIDFFMAADREDSSYGQLAVGMSAVWANGWSGYLSYRHNFGDDLLDTQQVNAGLRMEF
ncbi:MAG: autotransporter outer membrane beta-barrel domain-containing protein [Lysobacterales bacterium]